MAAHRRNNFLINKKFQLKFSFYVCSWLFALSMVYPMIIYNLFDFFIGFSWPSPSGDSVSSLESVRQEVLGLLIMLQVVFLIVTFLISLFVSHRVAGPIVKLKRFLSQVKDGQYSEKMVLRKSDHFVDVAEDFNEMSESLQNARNQDVESLSGTIARIENTLKDVEGGSRESLENAVEELRQVRERISK